MCCWELRHAFSEFSTPGNHGCFVLARGRVHCACQRALRCCHNTAGVVEGEAKAKLT